MTRQEFIELATVEVTPEEYSSIEAVYMNSDVDKYKFCAMWREMNETRVAAERRRRRAAAKHQQLCDRLVDIAFYKREFSYEEKQRIALNVFSRKEQAVIESAGIDWQGEPDAYGNKPFRRLDEMIEVIRKYVFG
jgi:hypothetical protein